MTPTCRRCRDDVAAHIDGELGWLAELRLRIHLRQCASCSDVVAEMRRAVLLQQRVLGAPLALDTEGQLAAMRSSIAALGEPRSPSATPAPRMWPWGWTVVAGASSLVVVMVAAVWLAGRTTVLVPLGLEDPPAAVATQPDLFRDYAIIRKLDALEHFDAVLRYPSEELHPEATRQRRT